MEIMSRKDAKSLGHKSYYTGQLCKNGHLSYRYTQSGVCRACLSGVERVEVPANPTQEASQVRSRIEILKKLNDVRFRIRDYQSGDFILAAWAVAAIREPSLSVDDIKSKLHPIDKQAGTFMFYVKCFSEDVAQIFSISNSMLYCDRVDVSITEAKLRAESEKFADSTPPINFK